MVTIDTLTLNDVKDILISFGYTIKPDAKGFRANCLYRNGDNPSSLLVYKDLTYYDFVLQRGGNIEDIIKHHDGDINLNIERSKYVEKEKQEEKFSLSLLDDLVPNYSFFNKKGINTEILKLFGGGWANSGKLNRRYVFPIFSHKHDINGNRIIIGFSGRTTRLDYKEKGIAKWKHIGRKNDFIYPCHVADFASNATISLDGQEKLISVNSKTAILVESIGDAIACYQMGYKNILVLFGLSLSTAIINYLVSQNIECIIISTNNDFESNRGNDAALKIQEKLKNYFDNVEIKLPQKYNDWLEYIENGEGFKIY